MRPSDNPDTHDWFSASDQHKYFMELENKEIIWALSDPINVKSDNIHFDLAAAARSIQRHLQKHLGEIQLNIAWIANRDAEVNPEGDIGNFRVTIIRDKK